MENEISLPALVKRAVTTLANATSAAEVLEARDQAGLVYDAAKRAARLAKAKGAHDDLIAATYRTQADALAIEAQAKRRLADEYDAAQDRGDVVGKNDGAKKRLPDEKAFPATAADIGLTHKQIHEARMIRDAEERDPGVVERTVNDAIDNGEEPTRAAVNRAIKGPTRTAINGTQIAVPDGMTIEDWIREMMRKGVARIDARIYRKACDIVRLSDRDDLSDEDHDVVQTALTLMNETRQVGAKSYDTVRHIVDRVYGKQRRGASRDQTEQRRLRDFEQSLYGLVTACDFACEMDVPHMNEDYRRKFIAELTKAERSLSKLKKRIKS